MCYEGFRRDESQTTRDCEDPTRGFKLILLSVATSLDALGVGFSLGMLGKGLFMAAIWIGLIAGMMTWVAMKLGSRLSEKFGKHMERVGGLILMVIAVKLLIP
jgi:putative Mn2+ efflux pump MntP